LISTWSSSAESKLNIELQIVFQLTVLGLSCNTGAMLFQTKVLKREKDYAFEFPALHLFERSYLLLRQILFVLVNFI